MGIAREQEANGEFPVHGGRRVSLALAFALVSLVGAAVAAFGPARVERTTVSWPAPGSGAAPWATPLLLSAHTPQSLQVDVPCATVAAAGVANAIELFATTLDDTVADRLSVTTRDGVLEVRLGDAVLASTARVEPVATCLLGLAFEADGFGVASWQLRNDGTVIANGSSVPPVVSGFSSSVDPATSGVRVVLITRAASSHPSPRQWVATVIAALAAAAAFTLLPSVRRHARDRRSPTRTERRADTVVVAASLAWWLLGPWYFDDGWLMATVRARDGSGSFSNYFDTLGAQMPLGFAHHALLWPFAATDAPFLLWRTVPLVASLLTWFLVRRIHARSLPMCGASVAALAAAHLVFAFAWLLTLRPEPVIALLSAVACTAALATRARGDARSLCVALVCVAVAITMHPSGVVAAAPLVVVVAPLARRMRHDRRSVIDIAASSAIACAVGGLLLFADTDVARWRVDRGLFAGDGFHSRGVFDELDRYRDLLTNGTIPQLASVLVAVVALVGWLLAAPLRRGVDAWPRVFGAMSLAAIALLTLTPSKWTYHFGSMAAVATLSIGAEAARSSGARRRVGVLAIPVLLTLAVARSFRDVHDAQYFLALGTRHLHLVGSTVWWLAVLVVVAVVRPWRRVMRRWSYAGALGGVAAVSLVCLAALPTIEGPRWAMGRAGVDDLWRGGCPIARTTEVTDLAAGTALERRATPGAAAYVLDATDATDLVATVRAPQGTGAGQLLVSWVRDEGDARRVIEERSVRVPSFDASVYGPAPDVRHVRIARAADRPRDADVVVLTLISGSASSGSPTLVGVTAAQSVPLQTVLDGRRVLVSPPLLPLLRCTTPPVVAHGVAEPPAVAIGFEFRGAINEIPEIGSSSGPWFLARDVYATATAWGWLTDSDAFEVTTLRSRDANVVAR